MLAGREFQIEGAALEEKFNAQILETELNNNIHTH